MKLIDLHWEWMGTGELQHGYGLCEELLKTKYYEDLQLFSPDPSDFLCQYWGCDENDLVFYHQYHLTAYNGDLWRKYSIMRQNTVLLICAMHNEL